MNKSIRAEGLVPKSLFRSRGIKWSVYSNAIPPTESALICIFKPQFLPLSIFVSTTSSRSNRISHRRPIPRSLPQNNRPPPREDPPEQDLNSRIIVFTKLSYKFGTPLERRYQLSAHTATHAARAGEVFDTIKFSKQPQFPGKFSDNSPPRRPLSIHRNVPRYAVDPRGGCSARIQRRKFVARRMLLYRSPDFALERSFSATI